MVGWVAHLEPLSVTVSVTWSLQETRLRIYNLEMRTAVYLSSTSRNTIATRACYCRQTIPRWCLTYSPKGTHSRSPFLETKVLLDLCRTLNVSISAKHIPVRLSALAYSLSCKHQLLPSEWTLHQEVANLIFYQLGDPMVDLFAIGTITSSPCTSAL